MLYVACLHNLQCSLQSSIAWLFFFNKKDFSESPVTEHNKVGFTIKDSFTWTSCNTIIMTLKDSVPSSVFLEQENWVQVEDLVTFLIKQK